MPLLGLDLSLASTGFALLDFPTGQLITSGIIETSPKLTLSVRLAGIVDRVYEILLAHQPFDVYMETPISFNSGTSTIEIGMVHGAVRVALHEYGLPEPGLVNPSTLKKFATGRGRASKDEMVVCAEAKWGVVLSDDEADAAFVAEYGRDAVQKAMDE